MYTCISHNSYNVHVLAICAFAFQCKHNTLHLQILLHASTKRKSYRGEEKCNFPCICVKCCRIFAIWQIALKSVPAWLPAMRNRTNIATSSRLMIIFFIFFTFFHSITGAHLRVFRQYGRFRGRRSNSACEGSETQKELEHFGESWRYIVPHLLHRFSIWYGTAHFPVLLSCVISTCECTRKHIQ